MHTSGTNHYLACVLLILAVPAAADDAEDAIAGCARLASTGDRILCLENALRELSPGADRGAPAPGAQSTPPVVVPAAAATPVAIERSTASPGAGVGTDQDQLDDEIGEEQVRARTQTHEEQLADLRSETNLRVASYRTVPFERLVIELENGQIWRQIQGDVQRVRVSLDRNQTVDIAESRYGGYQLRLNEMKRTIRVERIE